MYFVLSVHNKLKGNVKAGGFLTSAALKGKRLNIITAVVGLVPIFPAPNTVLPTYT